MDVSQLKRLAGARSFSRGEAYFEEGRVHSLAERKGVITAIVRGQNDYSVRLDGENAEIEYSCSCPVGVDGNFCKHLVATALGWINPDVSSKAKISESKKRETVEDKIKAFLNSQEKEALIRTLLEESAENRNLRERLLLEAARVTSGGVDVAAYRRAITRATRTNGFVDYHAAYDYVRRLQQVIDSIAALLADDYAPAVIELTEFMLSKLEHAIGHMDDSDGHMSVILPQLYDLHHRACIETKPDPTTLARRLFAWETKSDWEIFYGAAENYADVFGAVGLAEYRRLADAEWSEIPFLGPGEDDAETFHSRFRITSIMEALARQTGDPEALIEIKRRDLSHAYTHLQIAEIYREADRQDEALEWAERGLKAFPLRDSRLVEFLACEYHRRARHSDAMKLIWDQFSENPSFGHYQELKANALKVSSKPDWSCWREKALAHLRRDIQEKKLNDKARNWHWAAPADNSRLVEIFLWEGRSDEAWQEATSGGCSRSLWLRVAANREVEHPADAIPIHKEIVNLTLKRANNSAYEEAMNLVRKIRELMSRLRREDEFEDYLAAMRVEYKRKRNFIKLLEEFK